MGVGASLQFGMFILNFGRGPAATDVGLARKLMFPLAKPAKAYASEPPAIQGPMSHRIQFRLCSGRLSVRSRSASFGGVDVPSPGHNEFLAA